MTHDPMCRFSRKRAADDEYDDCEYCELIAKVRADEKAKWTHVCPDNNCCHQSGDI